MPKSIIAEGKTTTEAISNGLKELKDFVSNFENLNYNIHMDVEEGFIKIEINGEDSKTLIGYRGEVLNALQVILNSIANKDSKEKARVILNVSNYREKREKSLEELADKISKTVLKTGKSVTLEPMMAYERKIIHNRLQSSDKIKTYSIGEEPHRKVVISKK